MPKKSRYTVEEVTNAVKQGGDYGKAAIILGKLGRGTIKRQGVRYLYERITKKSGATSALPPPTKEEREAIQKSHQRKAELTTEKKIAMRDPTWDEIADFILEAVRAWKTRKTLEEETNKLRNIKAALENDNRILRQEKDKLMGHKLEYGRILDEKEAISH